MTRLLHLILPASLSVSTTYTATISPDSLHRVMDPSGNRMPTKTWSFTTGTTFAARSGTTQSPTPSQPASFSCDTNLPVTTVSASATQNSIPPTNVIDNNINTKWRSTLSIDPWVRADLGAGTPKSICSVDIAWADGRQYSFTISVSLDGNTYTPVFSGERIGTTKSPQKYSFEESEARYVKITITDSHAGSAKSIAQISEIDIFRNAGTGNLASNSQSSVQDC